MSEKFRRLLNTGDMCPWCGKEGLTVSVVKRCVLRLCVHRCGYKAFIPKKLLTFLERVKYYDPKRYQQQLSCSLTI